MLGHSRWQKIVVGCGSWATAVVTLAAVILANGPARGEEVYYRVPVRNLKLTEGKLPVEQTAYGVRWSQITQGCFEPYVVLDGPGEAYLNDPQANVRWIPGSDRLEQANLIAQLPAARKITGLLFWPKADFSGMERLKFVIDAEPSRNARAEFLQAKQAHYELLLVRGTPGGAWFRHQLAEADGARNDRAQIGNRGGVNDLNRTFDLFSGGRAVSENLQLDRALVRIVPGAERVPLTELEGISVAEIDWKPLIQGIEPKLDPLASLVPADQHVVLFPSFADLLKVADRLSQQGTIVMRLAEPRSQDAQLVARYERQLGVSLETARKIIGPQIVGNVALTGSDPYFADGSDVALVFAAPHPDVLKTLLLSQIAASGQQTPGAKAISGEAGGLAYRGMRSDDRRVSSYVATLPGAVLLTNSLYQIERFAAVANKQVASVASLDEFIFFRQRYPRGDQQETALAFLSDATIRRWCGPRWRIAASRRMRDAAVLAELQAVYLDRLVNKKIETGELHTDLPLANDGALTLSADGVRSSTLGSLQAMTPIAEWKFDEVFQTEADAYKIWRDNYQSNWRWAFDPIALRLSVTENQLAADLSVMPLIAGSEYRQIIGVSRGAKIAPRAGDPHDALAQVIFALNTKNEMVRGSVGMLAQMAPQARLDPLGWLGQSVSIYADDDPFWNELAKCPNDTERQQFLERNVGRLPIALWAEVSSGFKLTAFLGGLRAFIEQTAPAMTHWESLEYRKQPYVKITPTPRALPAGKNGEQIKAQLFYVASGRFLLLTPSEAVLKRALDRVVAVEGDEQAENGKDDPDRLKEKNEKQRPPQPWLGENVGLQVDHQALALLAHVMGDHYQQWMQVQAWNNLPILTEWHRLYPKQDPLELHARFWHQRLLCPGGGKYVWNEKWQTMESTVYGHPGEPKTGPPVPTELLKYRFANFGLTFEEQGLRARMTLDQELTPVSQKSEKP